MRVGHASVSRLSPAIRHRLIAEEEAVDMVLRAHGFDAAEKFLQEICWRSYWKGWMQSRPHVWADYRREVPALRDTPGGREAARILATGTGNAIIDHFLTELGQTGYLHNHARMWFAGWWVHQMGLPWQLGAAHFMDHLLDADPASNTLSWRWVAGLQTPGKSYLTRAPNLERYLDLDAIPGGRDALARFDPPEFTPGDPPEFPAMGFRRTPQPPPADPEMTDPVLLWIHPEDLSVETWFPESIRVAGIVVGGGMAAPGTRGRWLMGAEEDALHRARQRWDCPAETAAPGEPVETLVRAARSHGTCHVVGAFIPDGPLGDEKSRLRSMLAAAGITWHEIHRSWDLEIWPLARAGFFPFWKKLSGQLRQRG